MPNPFTAHPASVGESYGRHCLTALGVSARLALATSVVFIHAFLPFLFETTGSRILRKLLGERDRGGKAKAPVS